MKRLKLLEQSILKPLQQTKCTVKDAKTNVYKCYFGYNATYSTKYVNKQSKCKPLSERKCTVKDAEILVNKCYFGYNTASFNEIN